MNLNKIRPVGGQWLPEDESESENINLLGTTAETNFIKPTIIEGGWLQPDETNAVVINTDVTKVENNIEIGVTITLKIDGWEHGWKVVGLIKGLLAGPIAYHNRSYLAWKLMSVGQATSIQFIINDHDGAAQSIMARIIRDRDEAVGMQVSSIGTIGQVRENIEFRFNLLAVFLSVLAQLIAAIGDLGLTGTMSINALARTREIGIMRALRASNSSVMRIVLVEGIFVGFISWLLGVLFWHTQQACF